MHQHPGAGHMNKRVEITDQASAVVDRLRGEHGELMFHQSGGCCDGSSPMCYPLGEFRVGGSDVLLGRIHGCPFYMARDQFELWQNTHLTVDVVKGRGASFSLEIPLGLRFVIHSRLFTDEELEDLEPVEDAETAA
jgi:uncharacterized protein (DUF779 family)